MQLVNDCDPYLANHHTSITSEHSPRTKPGYNHDSTSPSSSPTPKLIRHQTLQYNDQSSNKGNGK